MNENEETMVSVTRCSKCLYGMLWRKPVDNVIGECRIRRLYSDDDDFCTVGENDGCSFGVPRP